MDLTVKTPRARHQRVIAGTKQRFRLCRARDGRAQTQTRKKSLEGAATRYEAASRGFERPHH